MASEPALGFDCAGPWIAAAVVADERCIVARQEAMATGQAERLMPLLAEVLAEAGLDWRDLRCLGVGTGPGNFTGLRIAVAAARGLALGLGVPAVGVPMAQARAHFLAGVTVVEDGPAGQVIVTPPGGATVLRPVAEVAGLPGPLTGGAAVLATLTATPPAMPLGEAIARLAAATAGPQPRPAPLYLRPPDAAPAREAPPLVLG